MILAPFISGSVAKCAAAKVTAGDGGDDAQTLDPLGDELLLQQFEAGRLPITRLQHGEHVKLAYLYLCRQTFEPAVARMREGIKRCYAAQGIPEAPATGYHETMTQAWMRLVHFTLCEYGPAKNADDFCERHPQLSQKSLLRLFYSRALFTSPEAKIKFLTPDLAAFPCSAKHFA